MRFYGEIGYGTSTQSPPGSGIYVDVITERRYFGDVTQVIRRLEETEHLHDDIAVNNSISIVADEYAFAHFFNIQYVSWSGSLWTVTTVKVQRPRLILNLGSIYNGPTPGTPSNSG